MLPLNCHFVAHSILISQKRFVFFNERADKSPDTLKKSMTTGEMKIKARELHGKVGNEIKQIEIWMNSGDVIPGEKIKIPLNSSEFKKIKSSLETKYGEKKEGKEKEGKALTEALEMLIQLYEKLNEIILISNEAKEELTTTLDHTLSEINTALGEVEKGVQMYNDQQASNPLYAGPTVNIKKIGQQDWKRNPTATEAMIMGRSADTDETPDTGAVTVDAALGRALPLRSKETLPTLTPEKVIPELAKKVLASPDKNVFDATNVLGKENAKTLTAVCLSSDRPQIFTVQDAEGTDVQVTARVGLNEVGTPSILKLSFKERKSDTATSEREITVVLPGSFVAYGDLENLTLDSKKMATIKMEPDRLERKDTPGMPLEKAVNELAHMPAGSKMIVTAPDGQAVGVTVFTDDINGNFQSYSLQALNNNAQIAEFRTSDVDDFSRKGRKELRMNAIADAAWSPKSVEPQKSASANLENFPEKGTSHAADQKAKKFEKNRDASRVTSPLTITATESIMGGQLKGAIEKLIPLPKNVELVRVVVPRSGLDSTGYFKGLLHNIENLTHDITSYSSVPGKTEEVKKMVEKLTLNISRTGATDRVREILESGGKNYGYGVTYKFINKPDGRTAFICTIGDQQFENVLFTAEELGRIDNQPKEKSDKDILIVDAAPQKIPGKTYSIPEKAEEIVARIREIATSAPDTIRSSLGELAALIHQNGPNDEVRSALGVNDNGLGVKGSLFEITGLRGKPGSQIALRYGKDEAVIFAEGEIADQISLWEKFKDKLPKAENTAPGKRLESNISGDIHNKVKDVVGSTNPQDLDKTMTALASFIKKEGPDKAIRAALGVNDKGESINGSKFQLVYGSHNAITLRYGDIEKPIFEPTEIANEISRADFVYTGKLDK